MEKKLSLKEWLAKEAEGAFASGDRETMCEAGWYDWFCKTESLQGRLRRMIPKVRKVAASKKIDPDKSYVWFKNNCPVYGSLYDDFRIADLETGHVIYTVVPRSGFENSFGESEVWGRENEFEGPLASGTWKDVLDFFQV